MVKGKITEDGYKSARIIVLTIVTLISSLTLKAETGNGIQIDREGRRLIAPEGVSYQWYRNGGFTEEKGQAVSVEQSGRYRVDIQHKDGSIRTEIIDIVVDEAGIRKIYIIGDSTVQTYGASDYPLMGWGQVLQLFLDPGKVQVVNKAIGGRSSRSFWEQGRWDEVKGLLAPDDYVFIQFGHNDRDWSKEERYTTVDSFKYFMRIYVNETRDKEAVPVLVSPMIMNAWNGTTLRNVFTESGNNYRGGMLEVAEELDALFIDLNMKSFENVKVLGAEYAARFLHMGLEPGEYPNYPDGSTDGGTHFQEMGALQMAKFVVEGIAELTDDPAMAYLADAETPVTSFTTSLSSGDAGLITIPGSFPEGSHITLKTRLNPTRSFDRWEDSLGNTVSENNLLMLTLEDSSYYYKAIVTDCNGEVGGEAVTDGCLLCAGGTAEYPPCEVIFQCENACSYTGYKSTSNVGDYTRRVINTKNTQTSPRVEYRIQSTETGSYEFIIIYLSSTMGEQLNVNVNGTEEIIGIELTQDGVWNTARFELDLEEGVNTVVINSTAEAGGLLLDMMAGYSENLSEAACNAVSVEPGKKVSGHRIYPNPFESEISIRAGGTFEYRIFNTLGMELLQGSGENSCKLGSGLPRGNYLLQIISDQNSSVRLIQKN